MENGRKSSSIEQLLKKERSPIIPLTLPDLQFTMDALEPHISRKTIKNQYGKHHTAYVDKANKFIQDTRFKNMQIEQIIQAPPTIKGIYPVKYILNFANVLFP